MKEELTMEQRVLAARQRREAQRMREEHSVQKEKRLRKQEVQIVIWVTVGIFLGIPFLVFLIPGATAGSYMATVVMLMFGFPVLPILWLAVMFPLAYYLKKRK